MCCIACVHAVYTACVCTLAKQPPISPSWSEDSLFGDYVYTCVLVVYMCYTACVIVYMLCTPRLYVFVHSQSNRRRLVSRSVLIGPRPKSRYSVHFILSSRATAVLSLSCLRLRLVDRFINLHVCLILPSLCSCVYS